jgi:hypothetical protein
VSSTNVATTLNEWTPEQTNLAGTGSFNFSIAEHGQSQAIPGDHAVNARTRLTCRDTNGLPSK